MAKASERKFKPDLVLAVDVAITLTDNPELKDALQRVREIVVDHVGGEVKSGKN